ncbi:hypothetical protein ACM5Q3_15070, partial [Enterococcus gallinarum]
PTASDNPADYRGLWVKFVGEGVPGPPGENGQPTYTWLKYADDYQGTNMTDDPTGKYYIGLATNKLTATESNDPKDYKWQLVKGEDGQDAHIYQAYSWSPDGADRFTTTYPNENILLGTKFEDTNDWPIIWNSGGGTRALPADGLKITATTESQFGAGTKITRSPKKGDSLNISFEYRGTGTTEPYFMVSGSANIPIGQLPPASETTWTKFSKKFTYPDNAGTIVSFSILTRGTGKWTQIKKETVKVEFGDGSTWTPAPSEDFINAYPSYVGTYTTFDDVQSTNPADYTWQRILGMNGENGKDGIAGKDGVGVSDTNITYAQSTSGTSAPTSGWTIQVPALIKGQYLWTKTTWTYTDSSTETGYTVSYNAKDGNNGTDGIAGKDGVGISSTKIEYVSSTSGTVKPTTGWTTSIPTVPAGSFLWTKTTWTYTDGTNESGYSAAKMGEKGDQGIQGPKGSDGQTYYTWLKYADTPTSGMSDSPTGKAYIGLAYNKPTATESTNYADYTWSLIKGSDGAQGPKGDNGQTLYTWIKYATSATGAGMSDSPTGKTYIGLAYNKTTATESTNAADYTWSLIKGDKGDTGATGPQGPQGPTGPKGDRGLMGIAYVQQTQPSDKTEGVQWFKTDSTDKKIIASYVYKSGAWQEKKYASATLAVESLDALSASLGKITSGEINGVIINGSQFISPFDKEKIVGGSNWVKGTLTNADGMSVLEWTEYVKASGQTAATGKNIFYYDGVSTSRTRGSRTQTSYFGVDGIQLIDTNYSSIPAATLTIEDLFKIGATELSPASGFSIYSTGSTNLPTARRNGRIVQLAGAFKNNNAITLDADQITIGYVPEWARPDQATNTVVQGSGMNRFMLVVNPGGAITISRYGTTSYTQAVAGSWLNIACVYSAKDM